MAQVKPESKSRRPVYRYSLQLQFLGCVLCTLLTAKPAFEYTNMKDTYKRILKLQYHLPSTLSKPATDLIRRILVTDPTKRLTHRQIMMHEMIQRVKIEPKNNRHRSRYSSHCVNWTFTVLISSESALLPLTNLKRRMSDVEDAKDDVFQPSSSRPSLVKQEYGGRPRSIQEDKVAHVQSRNPFVAQTANYKTPARSLTAAFAQSSTYAEFGEEMRNNYNNFVMENNLVVWVTKWVDYSNR